MICGLGEANARNWMAGMKKNSLGFTQVEIGRPGAEFPRYAGVEIGVCEKVVGRGGITDSKFLVHKALLTPRVSRYPIRFSRPGCDSCSAIAVDSISRIAAMASGCCSAGSE